MAAAKVFETFLLASKAGLLPERTAINFCRHHFHPLFGEPLSGHVPAVLVNVTCRDDVLGGNGWTYGT